VVAGVDDVEVDFAVELVDAESLEAPDFPARKANSAMKSASGTATRRRQLGADLRPDM
jgi:hypothetical protein